MTNCPTLDKFVLPSPVFKVREYFDKFDKKDKLDEFVNVNITFYEDHKRWTDKYDEKDILDEFVKMNIFLLSTDGRRK